MTNHLWQSTVFAAAAWALALALRKNRAAVRHAIWLAASLKFLIPFSLLIAAGSRIEWRPVAALDPAPAQFTRMVGQVAEPFSLDLEQPARGEEPSSPLPAILFGVWAAGSAICVFSWLRAWLRARAAVRCAAPTGWIGDVEIRSGSSRIEPGVFGILRPVLLLPEGIEERLTPEQIRAIIAHEMAHVRRRDNLWSAMHMLVETVFWFHPAVWLIRARLEQERETACDEAVLGESVKPEVYAQGILNVCRHFLEPRPACVSGVSGADLRKRIEAIMADRVAGKLNPARRALLAAATLATVAGPVAIGLIGIPSMRAQEKLSFDVASIKINKSEDPRRGFNFESGRFVAYKLPLDTLIALAYDLPLIRRSISGGPDWTRTENFDVEGKADMPAGTSSKERETRMKLMLRTLLAERFRLELRREKKDMPVYVLMVAKNGPKLKKADIEEKDCPQGPVNGNNCHVINGGRGRGLHARAADMNDVALFVANWLDRPLIDKTGLKDLYQLDTEGWVDNAPRPPRPDGTVTDEDIAAADPTRPTVFMMFQKLGLKMEGQKAPVDVYSIEHAEQPAAN